MRQRASICNTVSGRSQTGHEQPVGYVPWLASNLPFVLTVSDQEGPTA